MRLPHSPAALAAAVVAAGLGLATPAAHAALDEAALQKRLEAMAERLQRLEQRNQELEQRLAARESNATATERALATDRLSESEPELVTRLKAVEFQTLAMQKQARQIEALEGITASASLVGMLQHEGDRGAADGQAQTRANYRGDVALTLPGGSLGDAEGQVFTQLRFGQGEGVAQRTGFSAAANSTAFQVGGVADADSSFAVLAQAWYQLSVPLPLGGFAPHAKQQLQINAGKMDPFVFFDQNAIADDETTRFVNNAFVHNPLLDSGGDVAADAYGFAPGLRVAYLNETDPAAAWGVSLGVFGAGEGANFSGSLGSPLALVQAELASRWNGLAGHWRLYAWHNGSTQALDGSRQAHAGWGVSADQAIGSATRVFGRYGQRLAGHGAFDRALTLGAEWRGDAWQRSADALGLAVAWLPSSGSWRHATATDPDLLGARADGAERIVELYYRWRLHAQLELTPDLQWIGRPAGHPGVAGYAVAGLRARLGF